jgi:bifunctional UDP-N-acetylglucosamine pyrophosphorylase / glucosamine-1-phosphate N-acetyltransferase
VGDASKGLSAIVLAAGEGKRLRSQRPKVLHEAAGLPLLAHVVRAVDLLGPDSVLIVASSPTEPFAAALEASGVPVTARLVEQDPPAGTGDAVRVALESWERPTGDVFVVAGDTPLIRAETLRAMLELHHSLKASATVLTATVADPAGYGRIVRSGDQVERIVEDVDADDSESAISEVNASIYVFDAVRLSEVIGKLDRENRQGEYYLTDVISLCRSQGDVVAAHRTDASEVQGVNTRAQLARVSRLLYDRTLDRLLDEGVTIVDPASTFIDASVEIEQDAVVHPFTFLHGSTVVRAGAEVGPQVRVFDSEIGPAAKVSFAVVKGSVIGPEASVGPFASLRPGTRLDRGARIGTFVETKNAVIGEDSKANHLAYLGDAEIGRGVNIGAGTITCNWDGREKHQTVIEDDAYISSDTMLVAPTRIGKRAATGAGAVVRGDVPDDALAVGVPARIIEGGGNKLGRKSSAEAGKSEDPGEEKKKPRQ